MEKKDTPFFMSEAESMNLLSLAKNNDKESILKLLNFFNKDILKLSKYISMPQEDAVQSLTLGLIELLKKQD